MVHNKELVRRHELARGKIGETILLNKMRKIKKIERERERGHYWVYTLRHGQSHSWSPP